MMQFIVPQFIDVEDKIFGPISVRQFITFLFGGAIIFIDYELFYKTSFWVFALSSVFLFGLTGVFAFLRINGRPFHYFLLNLFNTLKDPRFRVWNKTASNVERIKKEKITPQELIPTKKPLSASKLTQLSLLVDTGGAYHEEENEAVTTESYNREQKINTLK